MTECSTIYPVFFNTTHLLLYHRSHAGKFSQSAFLGT